jgi:hypothetical protein
MGHRGCNIEGSHACFMPSTHVISLQQVLSLEGAQHVCIVGKVSELCSYHVPSL